MSLSGSYGSPLSEESIVSILKHAFHNVITFFHTADVYGDKSNEILVGKALKQLPRERIQIVTKFGISVVNLNGMIVRVSPEYVRASYEGSLERFGVDNVDLYYQHRVDQSVLIEETMEYSFWTRDIEEEILPLCKYVLELLEIG